MLSAFTAAFIPSPALQAIGQILLFHPVGVVVMGVFIIIGSIFNTEIGGRNLVCRLIFEMRGYRLNPILFYLMVYFEDRFGTVAFCTQRKKHTDVREKIKSYVHTA